MSDAYAPDLTAGLATPPDARADRPDAAERFRVVEFLTVVAILNSHARQLYDTLQSRAVVRGFRSIAQFFGTSAVNTILAHLYRGMMRCQALDRMLRARGRRGFDLAIVAPRAPARRKPPADHVASPLPPVQLTKEQEAAARQVAARRDEARLADRLARAQPLTFQNMPSMEQIEAEVRRAHVGRSLVLICRDLGIAPSLCAGPFWRRLFDAIRRYGGSPPQLMREISRRTRAFDKQERGRNLSLGWPERTREGIRRVLGCCIGETPPIPLAPAPAQAPPGAAATPGLAVAAAATGPP
ncbi:MAG TPA: hypothetical protein VMB34_32705 [Acetobacteraceae bacterium]|nr:hypothetical protein [Acetobacteraceae bacterium]